MVFSLFLLSLTGHEIKGEVSGKNLFSSTVSNCKNYSIQYQLEWSKFDLDDEGKKTKETSSNSNVVFFYNDQNYLIKSVCDHYNSINDKTVAFYYWTPEKTYQLITGLFKDGSKYPSIMNIEESDYNPLIQKNRKGNKFPFLLQHENCGVYEPFLFGLYSIQLFNADHIDINENELRNLNPSSSMDVDLTKAYIKRFIDGHPNTINTTFTAGIKMNPALGYFINEFTADHILLSDNSPNYYSNYILEFQIGQFDEKGFPQEGTYERTTHYSDRDKIVRNVYESFHWSGMTFTRIDDDAAYIQNIIDDLEKKTKKSF
jgi:hypothetical protein